MKRNTSVFDYINLPQSEEKYAPNFETKYNACIR